MLLPHRLGVLNVHHLELFYYVARAGGITASLATMPYGIQQPAISSQLTRLEESVGTRLFQRKPFSLTPAGREIYERIAPFFGSLNQLTGSVRDEAAQHLRLAASANVLREHLPGVLKQLANAIPELRLTLREAAQTEAERMLREHEIDLAVALLERKPAGGLRSEALLQLPMVLLVAANAPFRTAAEVLRSGAAGTLPLISPPSGEFLPREFQAELQRRELSWPARVEASGLELIDVYVAEGFGAGISLDIPGFARLAGVRVLPLRGFPRLSFCALWSGRLPALAARFLELARVRARELRTQA
ncbi:MAG TPA: LysR family transcriptional regulator [Chthoniobacteraceae bacterium]|jgi:DNA-binding transcriptional LysR family regulator